jgi:hypothetical protein
VLGLWDPAQAPLLGAVQLCGGGGGGGRGGEGSRRLVFLHRC